MHHKKNGKIGKQIKAAGQNTLGRKSCDQLTRYYCGLQKKAALLLGASEVRGIANLLDEGDEDLLF